ncbi:hypothetical protein [Empedobacter falsenii]|uniref:hypothetical protein n=1 Tax=Empedobacter falsenii TaxID=343874 RepID=UPI003A80C3B1
MKNIQKFIKNKLFIFTISNAIVSLSNFIGPILLVYFLQDNLFSEFIYDYQIILFLIMTYELGISTTYISKFKRVPEETISNQNFLESFLLIGVTIVSIILYSLGKLNLSILILSPLGSVVYIYNKSKNLANNKFDNIIITSIIVLVLRFVALSLIYFFNINNINVIILLYFLFPYILEIFISLREKINIKFKYFNIVSIKDYVLFSISICLSGLIFNSLFRINLYYLDKYEHKEFISYIGFSLSLSGVVALINNSFKNFYINRLSTRNNDEVKSYIKSLKRISIVIIILPFLLSAIYIIYLNLFNPFKEFYEPLVIGIISIFYISFVIYFGLYNVLSKTFDFMKFELKINVIRLIFVIILSYFLNLRYPIISYFTICLIIVFFEFYYVLSIKNKIKEKYGINI